MSDRAFAYVLASCHLNTTDEQLEGLYYGDVIEMAMECEDQRDEPGHSFFLEETALERLAPVQLTLGWDPRPDLLRQVRAAGGAVAYAQPHPGEAYANFYYFAPPGDGRETGIRTEAPTPHDDSERFRQVLQLTMDLAASRGAG